MTNKLKDAFGDIDIYLFDQLLKGRYDNCRNVLDLGCGNGRNSYYFLKNGYNVCAADPSESAIEVVAAMAGVHAPQLPAGNFVVAGAEDLPFTDGQFDLVICSAVLHFAKSKVHFEQMLHGAWRVLQPGGFFFARLASDIGIESLISATGNGRYLLPDGSVRYLVTHDDLMNYTQQQNAELYEPIKTTNVSNLRCMTTWCLLKR